MTKYNAIAENPNSTVVAEYAPPKGRPVAFQSEADLEKEFMRILTSQAYEQVNIKSEADLITNLRIQLSKLNNYEFSDTEWTNFSKQK